MDFYLKPTVLVYFYLLKINILWIYVMNHIYFIGGRNENEMGSGI